MVERDFLWSYDIVSVLFEVSDACVKFGFHGIVGHVFRANFTFQSISDGIIRGQVEKREQVLFGFNFCRFSRRSVRSVLDRVSWFSCRCRARCVC